MGTKQNFKSALNELMAGKLATDEAVEEATEQLPVENFADQQPAEPVFNKASYTSTYTAPSPAPASISATAPAPRPVSGGMSILASDLIIEGNIRSSSDIRLDGHIKGNVFCAGDISCGGVIEGDVQCESLILSSCSINGNINAKADVTIDPDSTIIGDVTAQNMVSNGRVKGNIHTTGSTTLREKAMLMGNIHAKSISLDAGASLKGTLEIQTADLSDADFNVPSIDSISAPAAAEAAPVAPRQVTPPVASVSTSSKPAKKPSFPVFEQGSFPSAEKDDSSK